MRRQLGFDLGVRKIVRQMSKVCAAWAQISDDLQCLIKT
jgi:hypothetical protein